MMDVASRGWDRAFSGMRDALYRQGEVNRQNRSAELLPLLANATDQESAEAAIAAFSQMAPHHVSPELAQAIVGLREQAQEFEMNQIRMSAARRGSGSAAQDAATNAVVAAAITGGSSGESGEGAGSAPSAEATEGGSPFARSGRPSIVPQTMGTTDLSFGAPASASTRGPLFSGNEGQQVVQPLPAAVRDEVGAFGASLGASELQNPAVRPYVGAYLSSNSDPYPAPQETVRPYSNRPTASQHTDMFGMGPTFRAGDMLARGLDSMGMNPETMPPVDQRFTPPTPSQRPQQSPQPNVPADVAAAPVPLSVQPTAPGTPAVPAQPVSERLTFGNPAPLVAPAAPAQVSVAAQTSVAAPSAPATPDTSGYNTGTSAGYTPQGLPGMPTLPPAMATPRVPLSQAVAEETQPIMDGFLQNPNADPEVVQEQLDAAIERVYERRDQEDQENSAALEYASSSYALHRTQIADQRADADWNEQQEAEQLRESAGDYIGENFALFRDREDLVQTLLRSGASEQERNAYLDAWDALPEETFNLPEADPETVRRFEAAIAAVGDDTQLRLDRNPLIRAASEMMDSEGGGESTLAFLDRLAEGETPVDRGQALAVINRVAQATGLARPIIHAAVENSLVEGTIWMDGIGRNQVGINEDALMESLEIYSETSVLQDATLFVRERRADQDRLETLSERMLNLDQRILRLQEQTPEEGWASNPALLSLQQDRDTAQNEFTEITQRIELFDGASVPGWGPQVDPELSAEEAAAQAAQQERELAANRALEAAVADGITTPSPNGYVVDPTASGANQVWNQVMRDADFDRTLLNINTDLALSGGSPANRAWGAVSDFFQPRVVAEENQAGRGMMVEAMDWYRSQDAQLVFRRNPALLAVAEQDPLGFYRRVMSDSLE